MSLSRHSELPLRAIAPVESRELLSEVLNGLTSTPKTLPAKLFYDDEGARLFERICTLDEYYLTRSELSILRARVGEIATLAGPACALIEYGSGAGTKIRLLLDALHAPAAYVPIDISHLQLERVAADLASDYPRVAICPLCADYTRPLTLPALPPHARRLAFFPGSTIGNFHPAEASAFLTRIRRTVGPGGMLVLGVDRRKDTATLHAAYDDPHGITAAFNLNMLRRINRELGADFDVRKFQHLAFFNDQAGRVEMHLVSTEDQVVHVAGTSVEIARSETIWTESSYKYDEEQLANVVGSAGFSVERLWTDRNDHFWVSVLVAT
ncbi:MAG TPA: L-histidine N(alpha)-methyltransferase [Gemmatimonadaceae bacterium]|nr:L-histidine N(alpha)-methyltransferase [Gemmatimonadaceae bacterium]